MGARLEPRRMARRIACVAVPLILAMACALLFELYASSTKSKTTKAFVALSREVVQNKRNVNETIDAFRAEFGDQLTVTVFFRDKESKFYPDLANVSNTIARGVSVQKLAIGATLVRGIALYPRTIIVDIEFKEGKAWRAIVSN